MRIIQLFLTSATLVLATNSALIAERLETITYPEIAASHCNAEWARFVELKPDAWTDFGSIEGDPNMDTATTEAFNKYAAAIVAFADYVGAFVGLAEKSNHNAIYLALARAKYDLAICLTPTEPERDLITELALTTRDTSDSEARTTLFQAFDQFDCMQMAKASEIIFELDPSSQPFSIDFAAITEANMKVCD